jgi:peptidoglycan/LPS O-acetylase OafA/YrhL
MVILTHAYWTYIEFSRPWLTFGMGAVALFFVLSGYLIGSHLGREVLATGTISIPAFIVRRAGRIIPTAWIALLTLWGISRWVNGGPEAKELFQWMLFAGNYTEAPRHLFGHFWTLSVEMPVYLLLPLTMLLTRRKSPQGRRFLFFGVVTVAVGIALLADVIGVLGMRHGGARPNGSATHLWAWMIFLGSYLSCAGPSTSKVFATLCLIGVPVLFLPIQVPAHLVAAPACFGACFVINRLTIGVGVWNTIFGHPILSALGKRAFSIYLYQQLAFECHGLSLLASITLPILLAELSYRFIETPTDRWSKAVASRIRTKSRGEK